MKEGDVLSGELAALFARDLARVAQELKAFPDTAAVWRTFPGMANAAGTLALHLEGNLREYVGRQLGSLAYVRDRPVEFSARDIERDELVRRMETVRETIPPVIAALAAPALDATYPEPYEGAAITTRQLLIHLGTHLNYHLGQMDCLRRAATGDGAIPLATLRTKGE